jgi:hypothetical protein
VKKVDAKIVEVTSFKGQSYGYQGGPLIFTFHDESGAVRFFKYLPEYGKYHLDYDDIKGLCDRYPEYLPYKDDMYYEGIVTDWGYDVEEGLCRLMKRKEMLTLPRLNNVMFKWVGPLWVAEDHRTRKRKLPKRNWEYPVC